MVTTLLEIDSHILKDIFAARNIPDLECGCEDEKSELNLGLDQLEEEE